MKFVFKFFKLVLVLMAIHYLPGCTDSLATKPDQQSVRFYPQDNIYKYPELSSFSNDRINLGLPKGWQANEDNDNSDFKYEFIREDGARLLVFCYEVNISEENIPKTLRMAALKAIPEVKKIQGTWELETSSINPKFEFYQGELISDRGASKMDINIGWRKGDKADSCNFGLVYTAVSQEHEKNQWEFLAILRSLSST